jgi:P-type Mg2+ transporter
VPLAVTTVPIVIVGVVLPYSPLAGILGFEPLPAGYFLFLSGVTFSYLVLVELAKRYLLRRQARPTAQVRGPSSRQGVAHES